MDNDFNNKYNDGNGSNNDNGGDHDNSDNGYNNSSGYSNLYSYTGNNIIQDNKPEESYTSQNPNPYHVYPTPELKEKKPKKRRFARAAGFVAAALVFGIVAGGAFQAYYILAWPEDQKPTQADSDITIQVNDASTDTSNGIENVSDVTSSGDKVVTDVSDVVEKVMPSIVAINSTVVTTTPDFFGRQYQQEGQSSGSGIIIGQSDTNLLIVTNNHVIQDATKIEIAFSDETTAEATVKGSDAHADLAVLSVDMSTLSQETAAAIKVATLGSSDAMVPGDMVIAIGNALGYGQSVTVGYVSAVNREVTIEDQKMTLLQTDAAINPGNSGGALLNIRGEVIGINSVKFASAEVEGMGYAIPISSAIPMINELKDRQVISASEQGFLGIDAQTAQEVTEVYSQRFNMPIGIYVNDVVADSPAAKAGLAQGDIITGLDGVKIESIDDLKNALSYKKAGQSIKLTIQVLDGGSYAEKVLDITLGNK